MPIVNYVREHCAFMDYAADNGLTGAERLVWYALIHEMNRRANGPYWPDGFIRISNKRMLALVPMGEDAFMAARNRLAQRGLIQYQKGRKNAELPCYKVRYLTAPEAGGEEDAESYPPKVDNSCGKPVDNLCEPGFYPNKTGNIGGNVQGNIAGNARGNIGDINKLNVDEEEEEAAAAKNQGARAWSAFASQIEDALAEVCNGSIYWQHDKIQEIARICWACGLSPAQAYEAANLAVTYGPEDIAGYTKAVLRDMHEKGAEWVSPCAK